MQSATLLGALSSWEVIVSCLGLMLLLPLVFAVASKRSPPRRPAPAQHTAVRPARPKPASGPASPEDQPEEQA